MEVKSYRDLKIWQKSIDLVEIVYKTVKFLPKEELYSLTDQIKRASVSIPCNIAEGHQRNSTKDYLRFLFIAKGSLGELVTRVIICERLDYLSHDQTIPVIELCDEVGKMLNTLIIRLQNSGTARINP